MGTVASFALLLLAITVIFPITHKPDQAEATPGTVEIPTLAMVVGKENANVDIVPTNSIGSFSASSTSNMAEFNITTTNYTGYTLSISASDDLGLLTNSNTGDTLSSITSATTEADFSANTTQAAADYNGRWGYQASKYNTSTSSYDTLFDGDFLPAPTTTATILDTTATANTTANNYSIAIGARTDYTKPNGTYSNIYTLAAVANPIAYAITYYSYNDNTGNNEVVGTQASETGTATVTLSPTLNSSTLVSGNTIVRNGADANSYTFKSWCLGTVNSTAEYAPATTCTGTEYTNGSSIAGATLPIDPTIDNTDIKLYAVWDPTTFNEAYTNAGVTTKVSGHYRMLDMSSNICGAITTGQKEQLTDSRSGNYVYWVAKLKDNKCWMVQNLRLGTNGNVTLTSADSNISVSSWTLNNKISSGVMPYTTITDSVDKNTANIYNGNAYYCSPTSSNNYVSCYYNWYTTTVGTGTSSTGAGVNTTYNICPKNWTLPTGGSSGDFQLLYNRYSSPSRMLVGNPTTTYDNPNGTYLPGFLLSGVAFGQGPFLVGEWSSYWSRSSYSTGYGYRLYMSSTAAASTNHSHKYDGSTLRCLVHPNI